MDFFIQVSNLILQSTMIFLNVLLFYMFFLPFRQLRQNGGGEHERAAEKFPT